MLRMKIVSILALLLTLALASPLAATPHEFSWASWIEDAITGITETIAEVLLSAARTSVDAPATSESTEENAVSDEQEEEPTPEHWPGFDPVG